ncbi:hypothetical protein PI124_g23164 [Phytophthora idaei]|nr:hypothetical protein PI126_g23141 [Phytophthora idaei]KAG3231741.1 hypothetical protein PI124_g23164 [Phytophthora idaei]
MVQRNYKAHGAERVPSARSRRAGSVGSHERLTHAHDEDFTPGGEVGADEENASETDTPNVKPARKGGKAGRKAGERNETSYAKT